jgi:hypothetical protein
LARILRLQQSETNWNQKCNDENTSKVTFTQSDNNEIRRNDENSPFISNQISQENIPHISQLMTVCRLCEEPLPIGNLRAHTMPCMLETECGMYTRQCRIINRRLGSLDRKIRKTIRALERVIEKKKYSLYFFYFFFF